MTWYWPPSWFKPKPRPIPPMPKCSYDELTAEFFWLPREEQLQVLYYLGIEFDEQSIILASARPHPRVKHFMANVANPTNKLSQAEKPTAAMYLDRLKSLHCGGKSHFVEIIFQNIFRDKKEAIHYASKVAEWNG